MKRWMFVIVLMLSVSVIAEIAGYKVDKMGIIILLDENGKSIERLEYPNKQDEKAVEELDQKIKDEIIKYINMPKYHYKIEACRKVGNMLLIDCGCRDFDDGNIHIIYDLKKKQIIGKFCWYSQG